MGDEWRPALDAIGELSTRVEQAGLVQGAIASGFLARCRQTTTVAELAGATGLDRAVVEQVCGALRSAGVLDGDGDRLVVGDRYAPLLDRGLHRRALDRLAAATVRATLFRELFDAAPASYQDIPGVARLALAAGATADPATEFGRDSLVAGVRADPDWHAAFTNGGRFLDLGCGVAGGIVSFLCHYPRLRAVGIDLAEDVLDVARARAAALGVADRATFLVADAAAFRDPEPFDVVFWPQTFYPEPTRAAALATAFASLRPGGLLTTVCVPPRSPAAGGSLDPVLRALWGIRERPFAALRAELADAGFVAVTAAAAVPPVQPLVTARRPG